MTKTARDFTLDGPTVEDPPCDACGGDPAGCACPSCPECGGMDISKHVAPNGFDTVLECGDCGHDFDTEGNTVETDTKLVQRDDGTFTVT